MYSVFGLRDPDYSNMIIEGIKFIVVITMKYVYKVMDGCGRPQNYNGPQRLIYTYESRREVYTASIMEIIQIVKAGRVRYMLQ